jgi:hypothetical protein
MIANDKKLHFVVSASIVLAIWQIVSGWSVLIAVLVGISKEVYDKKTTGFDTKDLLFDVYGIVAATLFEVVLMLIRT